MGRHALNIPDQVANAIASVIEGGASVDAFSSDGTPVGGPGTAAVAPPGASQPAGAPMQQAPSAGVVAAQEQPSVPMAVAQQAAPVAQAPASPEVGPSGVQVPPGWVPPDRFETALSNGRKLAQALESTRSQQKEFAQQAQHQQQFQQQQLAAREQELAAMKLQMAQMQSRQQPPQHTPPSQRPASRDPRANRSWLDRQLDTPNYTDPVYGKPPEATGQPWESLQGRVDQLQAEAQQRAQQLERMQRRDIRNQMESMIGSEMQKHSTVLDPRRLRMELLDAAIEHGMDAQVLSHTAQNFALNESLMRQRAIEGYFQSTAQATGNQVDPNRLAELVKIGFVNPQSAPASMQTQQAPAPAMPVATAQRMQAAPQPPAPRRTAGSAAALAPHSGPLAPDGLPMPTSLQEASSRAAAYMETQGFKM